MLLRKQIVKSSVSTTTLPSVSALHCSCTSLQLCEITRTSRLMTIADYFFFVLHSIFRLKARRYANASSSYGPASVCLCLSQVGVLSKGMDG